MSELLLIFLLCVTIGAVGVLLSKYLALKSRIEARAQERYAAWCEKELHAIRKQYEDIAHKQAAVQFQQWAQESETVIRKDAIEKSRVVILGKVTEHLVPFFPGFQHNPKDARFIGSPVDFVVFDGLDEGAVRGITFVEVKTGVSSLSTRERQIKNVLKQRLVEWEELRIPTTLPQQPAAPRDALPETQLETVCSDCGQENHEQASFCSHCGNAL